MRSLNFDNTTWPCLNEAKKKGWRDEDKEDGAGGEEGGCGADGKRDGISVRRIRAALHDDAWEEAERNDVIKRARRGFYAFPRGSNAQMASFMVWLDFSDSEYEVHAVCRAALEYGDQRYAEAAIKKLATFFPLGPEKIKAPKKIKANESMRALALHHGRQSG